MQKVEEPRPDGVKNAVIGKRIFFVVIEWKYPFAECLTYKWPRDQLLLLLFATVKNGLS
jgi:hypothetical protein